MNLKFSNIVKGNGKWKIQFDKKSNQWIGYCDELGLTASGYTKEDLYLAIHESVVMIMDDVLCSGIEV
jgi:hypothetical protein